MSKSLLAPVAIAGLLLGLAGPAWSAEPCRIIAPRYEPKIAKPLATDPARFLGGARLSRPVTAPCPRKTRPVDA